MVIVKERYVIDENGNRSAVLINMKDYSKLLEDLEELESIRSCAQNPRHNLYTS